MESGGEREDPLRFYLHEPAAGETGEAYPFVPLGFTHGILIASLSSIFGGEKVA